MMKRILRCLLAVLLLVPAQQGLAQYPSKPIHIVVPSAPGDGSDLTARLISDKLSAALGQPVIVDNKLGAGGVVGTEYAARPPAEVRLAKRCTSLKLVKFK